MTTSTTAFFEKHKTDKTELKVFIAGGAMLSGKIVSYDDLSIVLNKCLIFRRSILSVTPV